MKSGFYNGLYTAGFYVLLLFSCCSFIALMLLIKFSCSTFHLGLVFVFDPRLVCVFDFSSFYFDFFALLIIVVIFSTASPSP